jgi:hypothetical protein
VTDKRKRAARAVMAETGWNYTRALREADRRHAEAKAEEPALPPVAGPLPSSARDGQETGGGNG